MSFRWKPSKTAKREFAHKMDEIDEFCNENGIQQSRSSDSYYFVVNGKSCRVSNHTTASSNRHAYNKITGEQVRPLYHVDDEYDIEITAGKTRIIQIYNDLKAGYDLDKRGFRKNK